MKEFAIFCEILVSLILGALIIFTLAGLWTLAIRWVN